MQNECSKCLMPGSVVDVQQNGCNYCLAEIDMSKEKGQMLSNDNLNMTLDKLKKIIKNSSSKYDCLVGITGGRDSGFLLNYVKNRLNTNPLAVYYDTGFMTDEARKNAEAFASVQGVDFITFKLDEKFNKKLIRGFFINYGEFCSPCHQGHEYIVAKAAKDYNIPVYIRGINSKLDYNYIDSNYSGYYCKSEEEFNRKIDSFREQQNITDEEIQRHSDFLNICNWKTDFLTIDLPDLYDVKSDFHTTNKLITDLYDWKHPKGQFFHSDCKINTILEYMKYRKHGYSGKNVQISNLLKFDEISIDEGKELLISEEVTSLPPTTIDFLKYLNLENGTLTDILNQYWT